jgi:hypothetical protein
LPPVAGENEVEDDFMVDDDNNVVLPFDDHDPDAVDDSASGSKEEEDQPDRSVLDLYEKLFLLRSNPLGLERFSREEKVQIELLELLRELKAPLKAFSQYSTGLLNQTHVVMCSRLDVNPLARRW